MEPDPILATEEELIAFCKANRNRDVRIVRLSEAVIVKFGLDVTEAEFANQRFVWEHTSASTFRVPEPIRYFQDESLGRHLIVGYLVMEFVHGTDLSLYLESATASQQEEVVDGFIQALDHLAAMPPPIGQAPGPIGGGPPRGYLWSDDGINSIFNSIPELEDFLNNVLDYASGPDKDKFDFVSANLIMCHTDLAPRNILKLDDGRLALLDWANAGCYPCIFETYALRTRVDREPIFSAVLSRLPQEVKDEKQIELLASVESVLLWHGDVVS